MLAEDVECKRRALGSLEHDVPRVVDDADAFRVESVHQSLRVCCAWTDRFLVHLDCALDPVSPGDLLGMSEELDGGSQQISVRLATEPGGVQPHLPGTQTLCEAEDPLQVRSVTNLHVWADPDDLEPMTLAGCLGLVNRLLVRAER